MRGQTVAFYPCATKTLLRQEISHVRSLQNWDCEKGEVEREPCGWACGCEVEVSRLKREGIDVIAARKRKAGNNRRQGPGTGVGQLEAFLRLSAILGLIGLARQSGSASRRPSSGRSDRHKHCQILTTCPVEKSLSFEWRPQAGKFSAAAQIIGTNRRDCSPPLRYRSRSTGDRQTPPTPALSSERTKTVHQLR